MRYLLLLITLLVSRPALALPEDDRDFDSLTRLAALPTDTRVESVAFSPNQEMLAAGLNGRILIWDGKLDLVKTLELDGNTRAVPDRELTAADPLRPAEATERWVLALVFSPDNKSIAAGCSDGTVRQWDIATEKGVILSDPDLSKKNSPLLSHKDAVSALTYSRDGKLLLSGSDDRTAKLWDAQSGALRHRLTGHVFKVLSVAFSLDGAVVTTLGAKSLGPRASDFGKVTGEFNEWNAATGVAIQSISVRDFNDVCATLSPDGRVAVCERLVYRTFTDEGIVMTFWNTHTGEYVRAVTRDGKLDPLLPGGRAVFSDYGGLLVAAGASRPLPKRASPSVRPAPRWRDRYPAVRLWDTQSGRPRMNFAPYRSDLLSLPPVRNIAISQTAKTFAFACNNATVEVWAVP